MGNLNRIIAVAQITFRETIRNKILMHMLGFAVVMFGLAWVVSNWSLGEPDKIIADLGLTITVLIGVIIALFAGIVLVWGEVERGTILPTLAKPLTRWEFVLGKFLGFSGSVLLVYCGMSIFLILLLSVLGRPPTLHLIKAIYLAAWEIELVIALAVLFSSFSSPGLSAMFTILIFVTGRFSGDIKLFIEHNPATASRPVLESIYAIIPHLGYFNVRHAAVHSLSIPWEQILWSTLYGLAYAVVVLALAVIAFRSRDLA